MSSLNPVWLPRGLEFLSGLPEAKRKRRLLMPIQVYVDDSGGKGHTKHLVLAGLAADAEHWAAFSDEWAECLNTEPKVEVFKMQQAATLNRQFRFWSEEDRDNKLIALAGIINRYARQVIYAGIDLEAHAETWGKYLPKPHKDPFFYAFLSVILGFNFHLYDKGLREPYEIIFDEQAIFGPRFKKYYPAIRASMKLKHPKEYEIMPVEPMFRKDDDFLPIQAADLYAWCIRKNSDVPGLETFGWLLPHLRNVRGSDYSSYFDKERMIDVLRQSNEELERGVPKDLLDEYEKINKS